VFNNEPVVLGNLITFVSAGVVFFGSVGIFHVTNEQQEALTVAITSIVHLISTLVTRSKVTPVDKG
jgi:ABC-type uncharacterized transport system permease subunit